jgi:hypothetical protein
VVFGRKIVAKKNLTRVVYSSGRQLRLKPGSNSPGLFAFLGGPARRSEGQLPADAPRQRDNTFRVEMKLVVMTDTDPRPVAREQVAPSVPA